MLGDHCRRCGRLIEGGNAAPYKNKANKIRHRCRACVNAWQRVYAAKSGKTQNPGVGKGRKSTGYCTRGHKMVPGVTAERSGGRWAQCIICRRLRQRWYTAKKRDARKRESLGPSKPE